tara:strand:+ start:159 stop:857 length:699 start_codon:yes stop_codon:yes gene_type:complete
MSSCSVSKKSLIRDYKIVKTENESLNKENNKLLSKIKALELALEEYNNESAPLLNINPTIDIEVSSVTSQLADLEKIFNNDAKLISRFKSFKQGGIEKYLKVSYSDMQRIIQEAKTYKGTKHVMGGLSYSGIDCSGLLYVSFQANGITNIPRTAEEFARYGNILINTNDLQAGDLVFFTNTYRTSKLITHTGIYIGNGEFIHTSSSKGVIISKLNDPYYWREKFLFGTRVIN